MESVLKKIYYDASHPAGFSTAENLFKAAKEELPNLNINEVKDWLSGELTYTLHKPIRRKFKRNPIIVEQIDQQWEADLVDMQEFDSKIRNRKKRLNSGYNYILTVIDVLSKYAWAVPLKDKRAISIVNAFNTI